MGSRRKSRELAVQFLYGYAIHAYDLTKMLENFWNMKPGKLESREFAESLITLTVPNLENIDKLISQYAKNWSLDRIALIDKSILRVAVAEILYCDDVPAVVTINEAVEIAKGYSTYDAGKFVNGILDNIRKTIEGPSTGKPKQKKPDRGNDSKSDTK